MLLEYWITSANDSHPYGCASCIALPAVWKRYVHRHPSLDDVPGITQTGAGIPGDPVNVALIGTKAEVVPGPDIKTHEQLVQWIKENAWGHHPSGSAPMGAADDPKAVVDSSFNVIKTVAAPQRPGHGPGGPHGDDLTGDTQTQADSVMKAAENLDPSHQRVRNAIKGAESAILSDLRGQGLHDSKVPRVAKALEEITQMNFTPIEGFLLSRINGQWDLGSLIKISPIREPDAMLIFYKLWKDGIIALD